jgi:hypothetical protein
MRRWNPTAILWSRGSSRWWTTHTHHEGLAHLSQHQHSAFQQSSCGRPLDHRAFISGFGMIYGKQPSEVNNHQRRGTRVTRHQLIRMLASDQRSWDSIASSECNALTMNSVITLITSHNIVGFNSILRVPNPAQKTNTAPAAFNAVCLLLGHLEFQHPTAELAVPHHAPELDRGGPFADLCWCVASSRRTADCMVRV